MALEERCFLKMLMDDRQTDGRQMPVYTISSHASLWLKGNKKELYHEKTFILGY